MIGPKVKCRNCKDIIYSEFSGHFATCSCGAISIDSTPYYTRYVGCMECMLDPETDKVIGSTENDRDFIR